MPSVNRLISVFTEAYRLLQDPDNDFTWSSWDDQSDALDEIGRILAALRSGKPYGHLSMAVIFAPTGPLQGVSLSSGWGDAFLELAQRFDDAMAMEDHREAVESPLASFPCNCSAAPPVRLNLIRELGTDRHLAEATLLSCLDCGQLWLRYRYEAEAFPRSGRWFLGAVTPEQAAALTAENAKRFLEEMEGYYYGGSYYGGRQGWTSGEIRLNP